MRAFLGKYKIHLAGGAAVIAMIVQGFLFGSATPSRGATLTTPSHGILYGIDANDWTALASETHGLTAQRVYLRDIPSVPYQGPPGIVPIISLNIPLAAVASGADDKALLAWMRTLPSGTWLTVKHEANLPRWGIDPLTYKHTSWHMHDLIADSHLPIRYGQIFGSSAPAGPYVARGMSFYGFDGYQFRSASQTPQGVFGPNLAAVRAVDGPAAPVAMIETNTDYGVDTWARATFAWWQQQGTRAYLWFASTLPGKPPRVPSPWLARRLAREAPQS